MVTSRDNLIMNQTHKVDQRNAQNMLGPSQMLPDKLQDTTTTIQILIMSNQETSGIKSSPRQIKKLLSATYLDLLVQSLIDQSKRVSSDISTRSMKIMEIDFQRLLVLKSSENEIKS